MNNQTSFVAEQTDTTETKPLIQNDETLDVTAQSPDQKNIQELNAVRESGLTLKTLSEELRNDRDIVMAAISQNGYAVRYASDNLRNDKEIIETAIKNSKYAFQYASVELRADKDIVTHAIQKDGAALQYASNELCADRDIVMAAVNDKSYTLQYASPELRADTEVVLAAVTNNGAALQYANIELRSNKEIVLAAGTAGAEFVINDRIIEDNIEKQQAIAEVTIDGMNLKNMSQELRSDRDVIMAAVKQNGNSLQYSLKETERLDVEGLAIISYNPREDKDIVMAALANNAFALAHASSEMQNERDIVLAAVSNNGLSIIHASHRLRDDYEIVFNAISQNKHAIEKAGVNCKRQSAELFKQLNEINEGTRQRLDSAEITNASATRAIETDQKHGNWIKSTKSETFLKPETENDFFEKNNRQLKIEIVELRPGVKFEHPVFGDGTILSLDEKKGTVEVEFNQTLNTAITGETTKILAKTIFSEDRQTNLNKMLQQHRRWLNVQALPEDRKTNGAGIYLPAITSKPNFSNKDFSGLKFERKDLSHADFSRSKLSGASFYSTILNETNFKSADLSSTSTNYTNLYYVKANSANFENANFNKVRFPNMVLENANFNGASFNQSVIKDSTLKNCSVKNTDISNISYQNNITENVDLTNTKINDKWVNDTGIPISISDLIKDNIERAIVAKPRETSVNLDEIHYVELLKTIDNYQKNKITANAAHLAVETIKERMFVYQTAEDGLDHYTSNINKNKLKQLSIDDQIEIAAGRDTNSVTNSKRAKLEQSPGDETLFKLANEFTAKIPPLDLEPHCARINGKYEMFSTKESCEQSVNLDAFKQYRQNVVKNKIKTEFKNNLLPMNKDIRAMIDNHRLWLNKNEKGIQADFSNMTLTRLDLTGEILHRAILKNTTLDKCLLDRTILRNANLENIKIIDTKLLETDFTRANLQGAQISASQCFKTQFRETNMQNAVVENTTSANSVFAKADLADAKLLQFSDMNSNFSNANFANANFDKCIISHAMMKETNLQNSNISASSFCEVDMKQAKLNKANISKTEFEFSKLQKTDFSNSAIYNTEFTDCKIDYALFVGTKFETSQEYDKLNTFNGMTFAKTDTSNSNLEDCVLDNCVTKNDTQGKEKTTEVAMPVDWQIKKLENTINELSFQFNGANNLIKEKENKYLFTGAIIERNPDYIDFAIENRKKNHDELSEIKQTLAAQIIVQETRIAALLHAKAEEIKNELIDHEMTRRATPELSKSEKVQTIATAKNNETELKAITERLQSSENHIKKFTDIAKTFVDNIKESDIVKKAINPARNVSRNFQTINRQENQLAVGR